MHTLKHKYESAEEGGWLYLLSVGRREVLYISKALFLHPITTFDLPWCMSVCVCAPGKPTIDTQLSAVLIESLHGDHCASEHHKSFYTRYFCRCEEKSK